MYSARLIPTITILAMYTLTSQPLKFSLRRDSILDSNLVSENGFTGESGVHKIPRRCLRESKNSHPEITVSDEDIWGIPDGNVPQREGMYQGVTRTSGGYLMGMYHRDRVGIRGW